MDPKKITEFINEYILQKEAMSLRHLEHIKELKIKDEIEAKLHAAKYKILINTINDKFITNAADKVGLDLDYILTKEDEANVTLREVLTKHSIPIFDQTIVNNFDQNFEDLFK